MTLDGIRVETSPNSPNHKPPRTIIPNSSFFLEHRASTLPTPDEVRAINKASGNFHGTTFNRPLPVKFPSLGLFVKYGADASVAEAKTQLMVYTRLKGKVPVPEVFGWTEDGGQVFIYMALIEGETVERRWGALSEEERGTVCVELNGMVKVWRSIESPEQVLYVGGIDNQPLYEIFLYSHRDLAGPFYGADAVQRFQTGCDIEIDGESGWYPAYWEYCKAYRIRASLDYFDDEMEEEWNAKYLPRILDPVDDESVYHPWLWFVLSKGI